MAFSAAAAAAAATTAVAATDDDESAAAPATAHSGLKLYDIEDFISRTLEK